MDFLDEPSEFSFLFFSPPDPSCKGVPFAVPFKSCLAEEIMLTSVM